MYVACAHLQFRDWQEQAVRVYKVVCQQTQEEPYATSSLITGGESFVRSKLNRTTDQTAVFTVEAVLTPLKREGGACPVSGGPV